MDWLFFSMPCGYAKNNNMWCQRACRGQLGNNTNNGCYCDDKGIKVFCWCQHKGRKHKLICYSHQNSLSSSAMIKSELLHVQQWQFLYTNLTGKKKKKTKTVFQRAYTIIFWSFITEVLYLSFSYASLTSKWCGKIVGSGSMKNRTILICPIWHININKRCLKRNALRGFHLLI